EEYECRIDTMEVIEDHVHIFVEVPPKYSPAQVPGSCGGRTPPGFLPNPSHGPPSDCRNGCQRGSGSVKQ
ncbi:transposase, partial [Chloroflexota bacterium]